MSGAFPVRSLLWCAVVSALIAAPACGSPRVCTLVGGHTGFFVDVPGFPLPPVEPGVSVAGAGPIITVCIAGECRDTTLGGQPGPWIVPDDRLTGEPAEVTVTVSSGAGFSTSGTGRVTPARQEPNGPGCGTFLSAAVTLPGDGTLVPSAPR
ncbi:hypothetical protein [Nakamurella deserti]|uniref:hypothetical protein n=1 Tax=Nakamurella deserti TaxID=2164074 RepID=UPI000DBE7EF1|nr:hypothetical protein [Nakamurella deserti]